MTTHTEPTVHDVAERSRFEVHVDGRLAGLAQYRLTDPGLIVFTHTEIDDAFEGRGLGSTLSARHSTRRAAAASRSGPTARSSAGTSRATPSTSTSYPPTSALASAST